MEKNTTIIPLFKGGNKYIVRYYRRVSLLPLPGKMLEKIVSKILTNFIENNNLLSDNQSGFRKNYSTTKSIVDLTDIIFENMNNSNVTAATFIDVRKAFDTADHLISLKILDKMGIKNSSLLWC